MIFSHIIISISPESNSWQWFNNTYLREKTKGLAEHLQPSFIAKFLPKCETERLFFQPYQKDWKGQQMRIVAVADFNVSFNLMESGFFESGRYVNNSVKFTIVMPHKEPKEIPMNCINKAKLYRYNARACSARLRNTARINLQAPNKYGVT